jgi:hypothetical protein
MATRKRRGVMALAQRSHWDEIKPRLAEAVQQLLEGKYPFANDSQKSKLGQRKNIIKDVFDSLSSCLSVPGSVLCAVSVQDLNQVGHANDYFQTGTTGLAEIIRRIDPALDFSHIRLLLDPAKTEAKLHLAGNINGYALVRRVQELRATKAGARKSTYFQDLNIELSRHFYWRDFADCFSGSKEIFILQNALPDAVSIFQYAYQHLSRVREQNGQCRLRITVYEPQSEHASTRSNEVAEIQGRPADELQGLIAETMYHFNEQFLKVPKKGGNFTFKKEVEIRYTHGALPYVVYATDSALWLGWLWKGRVTNDGIQFVARAGTEFFEVVWDYLEEAWKQSHEIDWDVQLRRANEIRAADAFRDREEP